MVKKLLIILMISYVLLMSAFCFWKYSNFGYNGLDLAIFNQVFYNSAHGDWFQFSIHPQSYLGDHFGIIIIFLLPFYLLFQNPLTLLFLQSLFLGLAAWPLFLIVKKFLNEKLALFICLLWLFNPFIQNINLFEFHLLPFAVFFLLFAFYFYYNKNFGGFFMFLLLAIFVREDVALVTLMFGFLALIEKRSLKWVLWPIIISGIWFIMAIKIISLFAPAGQYKFFYYYGWLGSSPTEIINTLVHNPWLLIKHVLAWQNIFLIIILFLPFCFLPIVKSKYLLPTGLIFIQLLLGGAKNSLIVIYTHYSALLLPFIFIALIAELKNIYYGNKLNFLENFFKKNKAILLVILSSATLYFCFWLGPLTGLTKNNFTPRKTALQKQLLQEIKPENKIAASYSLLPQLSNRKYLYTLHYAYAGYQQFSQTEYTLPDDLEMIIMDSRDLLYYQLLFSDLPWSNDYQSAIQNMQQFFSGQNWQVVSLSDSWLVMKKNVQKPVSLIELNPDFNTLIRKVNINLDNQIEFLGSRVNQDNHFLNTELYFKSLKRLTAPLNLRFKVLDSKGLLKYYQDYELFYGLLATTNWQPEEIVKIKYRFLLPDDFLPSDQLNFEIFNCQGTLTLNKTREVTPLIKKFNLLGNFAISP